MTFSTAALSGRQAGFTDDFYKQAGDYKNEGLVPGRDPPQSIVAKIQGIHKEYTFTSIVWSDPYLHEKWKLKPRLLCLDIVDGFGKP